MAQRSAPSSMRPPHEKQAAGSPEPLRHLPETLPNEELLPFLASYGFHAVDNYKWNTYAAPPACSLSVSSHSDTRGHTYYQIACELEPAGQTQDALVWQTPLRLTHLRGGLHDPVRVALGSSYQTYFGEAPFAQHMRPAGTTSRLDVWCRRLGFCITSRLIPPHVVAATLRVLGVPSPAVINSPIARPYPGILASTTPCAATAPVRSHSDVATTATPSSACGGLQSDGVATTTPSTLSPEASEVGDDPGKSTDAREPFGPSDTAADEVDSDASSDFEGCPIADLDELNA